MCLYRTKLHKIDVKYFCQCHFTACGDIYYFRRVGKYKENMNNTEKKKPQIHCHSIAKGRVISFVKVKLTRLPGVYNITHMKYKSLLEKIKNHLLQS